MPPTLRRLENCCGQQLLRSQPSIPLVSERQLFRKSPPPIAADNAGDSSLPPSFHQLKNGCEQQLLRTKPNVHAVGKGSRPLLSICQHNLSRGPSTAEFSPISRQRQHDTQNEYSSVPAYPTSVYTSHARKPRKSKDKTEVGGANGQYTREIEASVEGAGITEVSCSRSYPVQLTSLQTEATSGLVTEPTRTSSPLTASWSTSSTPDVSNPTHNLHQGSTTSFPDSFANLMSQPSTPFSNGRRVYHSPSSVPLYSHSATQKQRSKAQTRHFVPIHVSAHTIHPFQ